jgi:pantoate--beta-alanine ligase
MDIARDIPTIRRLTGDARRSGHAVGLVPTMGALHEGHASLLRAARGEWPDGRVVVSIFVNPTQFGPGEDYEAYPRCEQADLDLCERLGADAVFLPSPGEMYPGGPPLTEVRVARLTETLCGTSRPGHFTGVTTVVCKLLNIVAPDRAYFGEKDYQQLVVIRRMVADLNLPVEVIGCPTVREADGLAMSSRNGYLTDDQRARAPMLHEAMRRAAGRIARDRPPAGRVVEEIGELLRQELPDGEIDYVRIIDPETLEDVESTDRPVRIALAVRLGGARLIDNLAVDPPVEGT